MVFPFKGPPRGLHGASCCRRPLPPPLAGLIDRRRRLLAASRALLFFRRRACRGDGIKIIRYKKLEDIHIHYNIVIYICNIQKKVAVSRFFGFYRKSYIFVYFHAFFVYHRHILYVFVYICMPLKRNNIRKIWKTI